jgi:predicted dinucleotide-binding enzyme
MRHYSAFQLDPTGHVAGRIDLNCSDDEDAKRQAEMLVDTFGLELWEDDRMVAVFTKKKLN